MTTNKNISKNSVFEATKKSGKFSNRVSHFVFSDGERYPMLLDVDGRPDYWTTLYITETRRTSVLQNTIERTLRHIVHLNLWQEVNNRDLLSEFSEERFLTDQDISSLRDHSLLNTRAVRKWVNKKLNISAIRLSVAHPTRKIPIDTVLKSYALSRIIDFADYLSFIARAMLRQRSNFSEIEPRIIQMKQKILSQKPKGFSGRSSNFDPDMKAPPSEIFEQFMTVVNRDSPENPFKNRNVRVRNELMFEIIYQTGLRAGEVLALRVGDIDFIEKKIFVIPRHDDPADPRKKAPVAKTLGRDLPITTLLTQKLREYVFDIRATPVKNRHPFLFVSLKRGNFYGAPISDSAFRKTILEALISTNPALFEGITRHGFRHNCNYLLSKKIDKNNKDAKENPNKKPISPKEEIQIRKQIFGWSADTSAERYNLRHIRETSQKIMKEDMDEMSKKMNKREK